LDIRVAHRLGALLNEKARQTGVQYLVISHRCGIQLLVPTATRNSQFVIQTAARKSTAR
jgi:hypothetical protein